MKGENQMKNILPKDFKSKIAVSVIFIAMLAFSVFALSTSRYGNLDVRGWLHVNNSAQFNGTVSYLTPATPCTDYGSYMVQGNGTQSTCQDESIDDAGDEVLQGNLTINQLFIENGTMNELIMKKEVMYFSFDNKTQTTGKSLDSSEHANDADVFNVVNIDGKIAEAYSFNGANAYITIPSKIPVNSSFSIVLWLKNIENTATDAPFFLYGINSTHRIVMYRNDGIEYRILRPNTNSLSYTVPYTSDWIHFVYTFDKDSLTQKLYYNGNLSNRCLP